MNRCIAIDKAAEPQPQAPPPPHYAFADALRGIAILGVVACHCCLSLHDFHGRFRIYCFKGAYGVQLFFIVSAFTLFSSLRSRGSKENRPVTSFFLRRLFRIAPLFWCGTFYYLLKPDSWRSIEAPDGIHLQQIVTTLTFCHGWSAATINSIVLGGWSIGAEAMFYLWLPFLFYRIRTLTQALWLAGLAFLAVGLIFPFASTHVEAHYPRAWFSDANSLVQRSFPSQIPVFCLGLVLYFLLRKEPATEAAVVDKRNRGQLLLLAAVCLFYCDLPDFLLASIALFCFAYGVAIYPVRWLVNPVTRFLGLVSYSIYIWHFAVIQFICPRLVHQPIMEKFGHFGEGFAGFCMLFICTLVITIPVATLSYYLIEAPFVRLGKIFVSSLNRESPAPSQAIATLQPSTVGAAVRLDSGTVEHGGNRESSKKPTGLPASAGSFGI